MKLRLLNQAIVISGFDVGSHGRMPYSLSKRVDNGIYEVNAGGFVYSWQCEILGL